MNRREFGRNAMGAALGASLFDEKLAGTMARSGAGSGVEEIPFKISVMLWTVFERLPFEQRLEKVAEAGYHAVQLVGEFEKWSDTDYRKMSNKKRALGITF